MAVDLFLPERMLTELLGFLPATTLGVMSICCRDILTASHAHWHGHLEAVRAFSGLSRTAWVDSLRGLSAAGARREYGRCAGGLPETLKAICPAPPTAEQVLAFIARVRSAHSWYKHLPIERGSRFQIFMSPVAGMRWQANGYVEYRRGDGTEFHYTWTTTEDYLRRYHLFAWRLLNPGEAVGRKVVDTQDMKPLLVPDLPSFVVPVTACVYGNMRDYHLLEIVYVHYKELHAAGSEEVGALASETSRWTRIQTGQGLPDEVVTDLQRLCDFELQHPPDTWTEPSEALLRDARQLCSTLFPFYSEDAIDLEVRSLLSSARSRFGAGPSGTAVRVDGVPLLSSTRSRFGAGPSGTAARADGARAQVGLIRAALRWISLVWGSEAAPEVSLSMAADEMAFLRRELRQK